MVATCRAHDDGRALRLALLVDIGRVVGFDAHAWLLTDPETEVGSSPLAAVPSLADLPRLIRLRYLTSLNRWTTLGDPPVASLRRATAADPSRSADPWPALLSSYGVADVASTVFRDPFGCWGFLDLWRTGAAFAPRELAFLAAIAPPVTEALRRCQARSFAATEGTPLRRGPVVLVLSAGLEVRAQTAETDGYLRALVPPDGGASPVPAGAYNVAAQLLAREAGVDGHAAWARVHAGGGAWLTLRAARMGGAGDPPHGDGGGDVAVTIERASPAERRDLFGRAHGLSAREAELVDHLARGVDTRETARAMFVSEHTVQDHLKSIFAKTGARSRRTLLARLAGP